MPIPVAMGIPLRKRLGLSDGAAETRTDRGVMALSLVYPYVLGGVLALLGAGLGHSGNGAQLALTAALCWGAAATALALYDSLPERAFVLLCAFGTGLLLWAVAAGATACGALLALPVTYAMFFLRKSEAAAVTLLAAGGYVAAAAGVAGVSLGDAAVGAVGIAAAGGLVGLQRATSNRLIWRLSDDAVTDPLTGLLNRRGFQELIETELERARRSDRPLSVIVGDLDHFKALNDRFGHAAGDRALEQLALILDTAKRRIDTAARIGGEEFAVVLPDSDQHAAYILAERMRREVRETFLFEPYELTISLGVSTFPVHGATVERLVTQADEALYAAKALGRDRTVLYNENLQDSVPPGAPGLERGRARHDATLLALADAVDARDGGGVQSQAVGRYAAAIARELGLPEQVVERVRFSGIVRDIGKVGIPEAILRKPGWLSAEDWIAMRQHPEIGASILAGAEMPDVSEWVLSHHERPDGTGYPHGLSDTEIPLEARILAVADAYEAMTSDRVYRAAMPEDEARGELVRCSGTQFDRRVVDAFLRVLDAPLMPDHLRLVR